jgi:hypothetical protein
VVWPACQWPTTAHAHTLTRGDTTLARSSLATSAPRAAHSTTASMSVPRPYPHVAATPRPHSPPLPHSSRQALAPLCSPPLRLLRTVLATDVAVVHEHWCSAIMPCHRPQEKLPACATMRPTALFASSFAWSSSWTATFRPPPVKQPTP